MTCIWLMKWKARSNLKRYESEKKIRNSVGKRKSLKKSKRVSSKK